MKIATEETFIKDEPDGITSAETDAVTPDEAKTIPPGALASDDNKTAEKKEDVSVSQLYNACCSWSSPKYS